MFLLTGCVALAPPPASSPDLVLATAPPALTASPTPFRPLPSTWTPTADGSPSATPTFTLTPAATSPPPTPTGTTPAPEIPARPQYTLTAVLDYAGRSLSVEETISYPNRTGAALKKLILAVEPNHWTDCFHLGELTVDDVQPKYSLEGHRLKITLPQELSPGGTLTISLRYDLDLPPKTYDDVFGYVGYQVNLVDWYPFVVPYDADEGWILHEPSGLGEHLVYDAADFDVNIRVKDKDAAPVIAASAPGEKDGKWTNYRLDAARTFVFSASTKFLVATQTVDSVTVTSYYFPDYEGAGNAILQAAAKAISIYGKRFGPYPYASLGIVETQLPDGMEYDGLIFMGSEFYDEYNGTIKNNLISIGVHEVAHQWWFGLVGNDQALEPWLDEALALYSERIYYESTQPYPVDWWWRFRVNWFSPSGWVDTTIYDGGGFRPYTNAVYLRGALFLEELRVRIGDKAFFAFLKDYAATYAHRRATRADFFATLDEHTD
ncbi:MAG: M1 family metallopeptidase, partial [Chloroflexi bacterium]|nr:M1 family metallopeptidase [Chloroflexota bacterium]